MGRDQRSVEITLEFKMSGLKGAIRDWLTNRVGRMCIRLRGREINRELFMVLRIANYRVKTTTRMPSRSIPTTLADHIKERREGHRINKASRDNN